MSTCIRRESATFHFEDADSLSELNTELVDMAGAFLTSQSRRLIWQDTYSCSIRARPCGISLVTVFLSSLPRCLSTQEPFKCDMPKMSWVLSCDLLRRSIHPEMAGDTIWHDTPGWSCQSATFLSHLFTHCRRWNPAFWRSGRRRVSACLDELFDLSFLCVESCSLNSSGST